MTKKRTLLTILIISVLLTALAVSGCFRPAAEISGDTSLTRVRVTRVIDGDTAYVRFPGGSEEKLRFIGVDAPEINHPTKGLEPFGPEAESYTRGMLEGKMIWLEFDVGERDQYDRLLAYLWLEVPDRIDDSEIRAKMYNARLLLEGYATQVIFEPNVKYVNYFSIYTKEAQNAGRGLWGLEDTNN